MGCNCGRGPKSNTIWIATNKIGEQKTFKTEIEARAYLARSGGGAIQQKELAAR